MPSPFPGMNPYLEKAGFWPDFQRTYLIYLRASLVSSIAGNYFAAFQQRPYRHDSEPKVHVRHVGYLEVIDVTADEVVTVIEALTPSNKQPGEDREEYLRKRQKLVGSQINLVELDFLRGGLRTRSELSPGDYHMLVSRQSRRPQADVWSIQLHERLPCIPIPLRAGEPEPLVDLQAVLNRVYDEAGYAGQIYDYEPEPRLAPTDAAWAQELIAAAKA